MQNQDNKSNNVRNTGSNQNSQNLKHAQDNQKQPPQAKSDQHGGMREQGKQAPTRSDQQNR